MDRYSHASKGRKGVFITKRSYEMSLAWHLQKPIWRLFSSAKWMTGKPLLWWTWETSHPIHSPQLNHCRYRSMHGLTENGSVGCACSNSVTYYSTFFNVNSRPLCHSERIFSYTQFRNKFSSLWTTVFEIFRNFLLTRQALYHAGDKRRCSLIKNDFYPF